MTAMSERFFPGWPSAAGAAASPGPAVTRTLDSQCAGRGPGRRLGFKSRGGLPGRPGLSAAGRPSDSESHVTESRVWARRRRSAARRRVSPWLSQAQCQPEAAAAAAGATQ